MAIIPETFFAAGTTLAGMTNLELTLLEPFQVLEYGRITLLAPTKTRALDSFGRRDGKINARLLCNVATDAGRRDLNTLLFGNQTTVSRELYLSAPSESAYSEDVEYTPFLAFVDRPVEVEDYQVAINGVYVTALVLPLFNCRVQSVTKSANATITTSERLVYVDTSGATRTMTLFAVASATPYTVYRFVKTSASNSMVLDGNGAETINGATTHTSTALNASVSIYTPDNAVWLVL
jgi:hypothetical protein